MALSPVRQNRLPDGDIDFSLGVDSDSHVSMVDPGFLAWGFNIVTSGKQVGTRPRYFDLIRLPDGRAQGFKIFTPTGSLPYLVAAVSGRIYVSQYPFNDYSMLTGIQFNPFVDHIMFKEAVQGVDQNQNTIDPVAVLMMQDGLSRPAYWDGATARHLIPGGNTNETVLGFQMEWIGGRLWVARGNQIFASDIWNPLLFTETLYLAEGGSLQTLDGKPVTAMARTGDNKSLIVFTEENTTIVAASVTDRTQWKTTSGFLSILFPGVGCVAMKSPCYSFGELHWYSREGARRFAQVAAELQSAKNLVSSIEMHRSFENMSPVASRACGFGFDIYCGFSVPSGDVLNRHTWVMDYSTQTQNESDSPPAWQGVWTGTFPVEWDSAVIAGKNRCFHLSQDPTGVRIWEAFVEDRNVETDILCSVETRGYSFKEPLSWHSYKYTEFHLTGVLGNVKMTCEWRGDYGCWKKNMDLALCALACRTLDCSVNPITDPLPQNRFLKTQEFRPPCNTINGYNPFTEDICTYVQNRIRWTGIAGLLKIRAFAQLREEASSGQCTQGDKNCKEFICCDQEPNYVCTPHDRGYRYGSSNNSDGSI
jgi:hypothetical protein